MPEGEKIEVMTNAVATQNSLFNVGELMPAARENTRDIETALKTAIQIVTIDQEAAKECFYTLPRGGKKISGPSIGLAETLASTWGNLIVATEGLEEHDDHIVVSGRVFDTQSGLGYEGSVRRNILKTNGERYNADGITNTINAATSILYRNLVLRVIPRPYVRKVLREAQSTALGGGTWPDRVKKVIAYWEDQGIPASKLLAHLDRRTPADLEFGDVDYLLALDQNIKNGDITIEQAFAPKTKEAEAPPRAKKRSRTARAEKTKPEPPEEQAEAPKTTTEAPADATEPAADDAPPEEDLDEIPKDLL